MVSSSCGTPGVNGGVGLQVTGSHQDVNMLLLLLQLRQIKVHLSLSSWNQTLVRLFDLFDFDKV